MTLPPSIRRIAVAAYQGVLADESAAFRDVLGRLPDVRLMTVGTRLGEIAGPGGAQIVDTLFDEVDAVDVVVVPGGLGSHRHPEIAAWVRRVRPQWVLTSSTGSALLAASGLLRGRTAATHWLAGPLLERHGAIASHERLVVDGPFVTCAGLASTFDAADVVVRAVGGAALVCQIRQQLSDAVVDERAPCPPARTRYRARGGRGRRAPVPNSTAPTDAAWRPSVEVELEDR